MRVARGGSQWHERWQNFLIFTSVGMPQSFTKFSYGKINLNNFFAKSKWLIFPVVKRVHDYIPQGTFQLQLKVGTRTELKVRESENLPSSTPAFPLLATVCILNYILLKLMRDR